MLRAKQRALDARPIKKVAEAKARKKLKAAQRLQKAVKKAEGVTQNTDLSERDKAGAIEKLLKKGMSSAAAKKKSEVKVVVAKGSAKGLKGRPKGVKGRYQMVDARGKKEVRLYAWASGHGIDLMSSLSPAASEEAKRKGGQKTKAHLSNTRRQIRVHLPVV